MDSGDWMKRLIVMGKIGVPHGIKGWVRINPFSANLDSLLAYPQWHIQVPEGDNILMYTEKDLQEARTQGGKIVAKLAGIDTREQAEAVKGCFISVHRDEFKPLAPDRYYWCDLVGMKVKTVDGELLGKVGDVFQTPSNDILVVDSDNGEILIPFLKKTVTQINHSGSVMVVDWKTDY